VACANADVADRNLIERPLREEFLGGVQDPLEGLQGPMLLVAVMPLWNSVHVGWITNGFDRVGLLRRACH
jgi:hypothetical protein